jgi:twitching motility protein PilT
MSRLEQLLTRAVEMRGQELWIAPGQMARARVGRDWKEVSGEAWAAHETKTLLSSPLSEFDKREFFENGFWKGQIQVMGRPFQANLHITEQGLAGGFKWRGTEALDWDSWSLPAHLLEVLSRTRGMTMMAGPTGSGKSSLLFLLMQKLSTVSTQMIHFYSEQAPREVPARVSSFPLKALSAAVSGPADLILVDDAGPEQWETLMRLCESGRHVVFTVAALDLFAGLARWRQFHEKSGRDSLASLQMGIGTRLVSGLENLLVPAVELLLVTQKLRAPLREGRWELLEEEMKASGEKTGMRTMNQSLLQLLLRRRIEMRTAFAESQNPDEFDLLLKKVGI